MGLLLALGWVGIDDVLRGKDMVMRGLQSQNRYDGISSCCARLLDDVKLFQLQLTG
jgi:hypothetical protein